MQEGIVGIGEFKGQTGACDRRFHPAAQVQSPSDELSDRPLSLRALKYTVVRTNGRRYGGAARRSREGETPPEMGLTGVSNRRSDAHSLYNIRRSSSAPSFFWVFFPGHLLRIISSSLLDLPPTCFSLFAGHLIFDIIHTYTHSRTRTAINHCVADTAPATIRAVPAQHDTEHQALVVIPAFIQWRSL